MYTLNSSNVIKDHKYNLVLRLVKMLNNKEEIIMMIGLNWMVFKKYK